MFQTDRRHWRYAKNLDVRERFLSFVDCSSHAHADGLSELLRTEVKTLGLQNAAMVAQSYDGAAVMTGHVSGVQQKMKLDPMCSLHSLPCTQVKSGFGQKLFHQQDSCWFFLYS
jgi:hypothetical protein